MGGGHTVSTLGSVGDRGNELVVAASKAKDRVSTESMSGLKSTKRGCYAISKNRHVGCSGSCLCACALAFAGADAEHQTYRQIVAKRPAPKIEGLAERASPDQRGGTSTESFWDLLKLRDQPAPAAVPELAKIMAAHEGSTRIHGFAAAQALYAAGTDEASRTLEKHLLAPDYRADMAMMYTSHWQMGEPQRSRFIESYLLRDLTDDLGVSGSDSLDRRGRQKGHRRPGRYRREEACDNSNARQRVESSACCLTRGALSGDDAAIPRSLGSVRRRRCDWAFMGRWPAAGSA